MHRLSCEEFACLLEKELCWTREVYKEQLKRIGFVKGHPRIPLSPIQIGKPLLTIQVSGGQSNGGRGHQGAR